MFNVAREFLRSITRQLFGSWYQLTLINNGIVADCGVGKIAKEAEDGRLGLGGLVAKVVVEIVVDLCDFEVSIPDLFVFFEQGFQTLDIGLFETVVEKVPDELFGLVENLIGVLLFVHSQGPLRVNARSGCLL